MNEYYSIITTKGASKLINAQIKGEAIKLTHFAIGDGDGASYDPDKSQTTLKGEQYKAEIQYMKQDKDNPAWLIIEAIIPITIGGFMIREVGVFDQDGDLFAIGKYPETFKPKLQEGTGTDIMIKMILEVGSSDNITLQIDPSAFLATQKFVESQIDESIDNIAILESQTIEVGANKTYKTIQSVIDYLRDKVLKGTVTIKVADGVHKQSWIGLHHYPYAHKIKIIGNITNPEKCELRFINDANGYSHGIVVENCRGLEISGFKITSENHDTNHRGIIIFHNCWVYSADNSMIFENCQYAIQVGRNSRIQAIGVIANNCDKAVYAYENSNAIVSHLKATSHNHRKGNALHANNSFISAVSCTVTGYYFGYFSNATSGINCDGSQAHDCQNGFFAAYNSRLWNHQNSDASKYGKATKCHIGFLCGHNSTMVALGAKTDDCYHGFYVNTGGFINARSASATKGTYGFLARSAGKMHAPYSIADGMSYGYNFHYNSYADVPYSKATNCKSYAYYAGNLTHINAYYTKSNLRGNANDYNLAHATEGASGSWIFYS